MIRFFGKVVIDVNYAHFGELLKNIRTSYNITLEQLADGICSVRQLSRVENGENNPSLYLIHSFSLKLNINLQEYYRYYFTSGSFSAYKIKAKFEQLISEKNLLGLRGFIETIESMEDFQSGDNRQYILYGKALCSAHLDKDNEQSIKYCTEGLNIVNPGFDVKNFKNQFYSGVSLTMINLIATNYIRLGYENKALPIMEDIFSILEHHFVDIPFNMYRSIDFEKKLYQSTSYNLSLIFMNLKQIDKALEYVDRGIFFSKKDNYMRFLPELMAQKSRILLKMNKIDEASKLFTDSLSFYRLCRGEDEVKKLEKEIEELF